MSNKRFPIQDGPDVPWEVMAPHNAMSLKNHYQTLERIAERGGFSAAEAYCIVNSLRWQDMEASIGWNRAKELWLEYAERINLHYKRITELEQEIERLREAIKDYAQLAPIDLNSVTEVQEQLLFILGKRHTHFASINSDQCFICKHDLRHHIHLGVGEQERRNE